MRSRGIQRPQVRQFIECQGIWVQPDRFLDVAQVPCREEIVPGGVSAAAASTSARSDAVMRGFPCNMAIAAPNSRCGSSRSSSPWNVRR